MFTKAKKIMFTTAVTATLCAGSLLSPLVALADEATGPGMAAEASVQTQSPSTTTGPGGGQTPGQTPGQTETPKETVPVSAEMPNYYLLPLGMPIVSEVAPYTYDQMATDLITLSQFYGSHMELRSLGKTFDNRDIWDIVVGNPNAPRQILIQGGIHGREYITSLLVMKQLEYALAYYDIGAVDGIWLSQYFEQTAIHFVPMVNPDGVTISQAGEAGIISPELRQVVNNVYQTSGGGSYALWKSNARGVDLNHNFDASWHLITSPGQPSSRDYRGEVPLSEPEAAALASVVQMYPIKTCLNYHSMGRIIYWDVAGNQQRESSLQLARMFSQATGYGISGEPGVGGFKDWLQIKNNPIPSITLEVGRSACPVPLSQFPEIWAQNRGGVALALQFVQTQ